VRHEARCKRVTGGRRAVLALDSETAALDPASADLVAA
jgi:hypothetical protein